jgi:predicted PurR-regulated permease PerM
MNRLKLFVITFLIVFGVTVLFVSSTSAQASIFDNIKDFFNQGEDKNVKNKEFTIEANIELAPDGDDNKNNEIDAGDIIRFTYIITNTTDEVYSYATLKTTLISTLPNSLETPEQLLSGS